MNNILNFEQYKEQVRLFEENLVKSQILQPLDEGFMGKIHKKMNDKAGIFVRQALADEIEMGKKINEAIQNAVDDLVIGACKLNYGINMFQEASGGIYNTGKIGGLPYLEKAEENRDIQYIPSGGSKDHIDMLYAILFYDHGSALYNGRLYPAEK